MEKTVLILGAGISFPYQYPSGELLVQNIIARWKHGGNDSPSFQTLASGLSDSGALSIDRFLSDVPAFVDIGLSAIVFELLEAEKKNLRNEVPTDEDIFKLFQNQIEEEYFSDLTVLTFNYDRLFEWKFLKRLTTLSGGNRNMALERFSKLKIEHIHGRLITLYPEETQTQGDNNVPYGSIGSNEDVKIFRRVASEDAIKRLKTVFTNTESPNSNAVSAIKNAKRIFFLGFSFDDRNMKKLGIGVPGIRYDWESKCVAGTCFRMPAVARKKVTSAYPFLAGRLFDVSAKRFFSEHFSLTDPNHDVTDTELSGRSCCEISAIQEQKGSVDSRVTMYHEPIVCTECKGSYQVEYSRNSDADVWNARIMRR